MEMVLQCSHDNSKSIQKGTGCTMLHIPCYISNTVLKKRLLILWSATCSKCHCNNNLQIKDGLSNDCSQFEMINVTPSLLMK